MSGTVALQGYPPPNSGTWGFVPLQGKRDFAEGMRIGILSWDGKVIVDYLGGPSVIRGVLVNERGRREPWRARKCD